MICKVSSAGHIYSLQCVPVLKSLTLAVSLCFSLSRLLVFLIMELAIDLKIIFRNCSNFFFKKSLYSTIIRLVE